MPTLDDIVQAMISTESSGRPDARGKKGEIGLMQIMPKTAGDYGITDPRALLDPRVNKAVGTRFFSDLLRHYKGDVTKALEAYNAGRSRVDSGRIPNSALTYAGKVEGKLAPNSSEDATRATVGSQTPRFSPDMMETGTGTGSGLGAALMRALSPTSASAAETEEIPRVGPPADVDTRIAAKMADRTTGTGVPTRTPLGTSDIDARIEAKLKGGASSTAPSAAVKPLPLGVRIADWLPTVGQTIGQYGGELGGAFVGGGPEDIPAVAAGAGGLGALGEAGGEEAAAGVRRLYGQPYSSQGDIANNAALAGVMSAASVPGAKVLGKVGETIAPSTLKAALAAKRAFGASREALDATMKRLSDLLGLDAKAAAAAAASPIEAREARAAYFAGKNLSFNQASQVYQDIGKSYTGRMTPNASAAAYSNLSNKYGAKSLPLLDNGIDFTRPTWRTIQQFRSNIRRMMRHLPEDSGHMASDLRKLEQVATRDMKAIMSPEDARRLDLIDQHFHDLSNQFPASQAHAIASAPNASKAMAALIKGEPSQAQTLLRGIDRLPMAERMKKLTALKKSVGEWVHEEGSSGKGYVEQLSKYDTALNAIPSPVMNRLFGAGSKESMHRVVQATIEFHRKMLAHPDMISAIQAEMKAKPLPWIVSHGRWVAFSAIEGIAAYNRSPEMAGVGLAFGLGPGAMHVLLNNSYAQKLYLKAVTAQSPKAIAEGLRALLTALASQQMREPIKGEDAGPPP